MKVRAKNIIPIVTAVLAVIFAYLGLTEYGFWHPVKGPMGGFYPTIISVVMFFVSIIAFVQSFKDADVKFENESWFAVAGAVGVVIGSYLIGMLASIAIYLFVWLKLYEKKPWKTVIIVMLVMAAIVYGVFVAWLSVPFPKGILFSML